MVRVGYDIIVIGGKTENKIYSGSLFKLTCTEHICDWKNLTQELKTPREYFVAVAVPDDFVQCN